MSVPPVLVSNILQWVRRLIKLPNPQSISDATILEYLNRFYLYDMPYRIQLFDLRTKYSFETEPNIDKYNAPINSFNSILSPCTVDNVIAIMSQSTAQFYNLYNLQYFNAQNIEASGSPGPYNFMLQNAPFVRGHVNNLGITQGLDPSVYITATDDAGNQLQLNDDGSGNLIGDGTGTVNYLTGSVSLTFSSPTTAGTTINSQVIPYQAGRPVAVLFYDNVFTVRPVPDRAYLISFDAYLTPAQFLLTTESITFDWMGDYLAYGTARRILQDFGDVELLAYNEPFFKEQEKHVLRRTTRQNSNVRVATIFTGQNIGGNNGPFPGGY